MKFLLVICLLVASIAHAYNPSNPLSPAFVVRTTFSPTPVTSGSPVTISSPTPNGVHGVMTYDSSSVPIYLQDYAGCKSAVTSQIIISASTNSGVIIPFVAAKGDCIKLQAAGASATTGESDITFFENQ